MQKKKILSIIVTAYIIFAVLSLPMTSFAKNTNANDTIMSSSIIDAKKASDEEIENIKYIQNQMVARRETISLNATVPLDEDMGDYSGKLIASALSEKWKTTSDTGDYLLWQYNGHKASVQGYQNTNTTQFLKITYTVKYYSTAEQETDFKNIAQAVLNSIITKDMSDYEKIKNIHDWMCQNIYYDKVHLEDDNYKLKYTAYAALVDKKAVCQGYANLFYYLTGECNIPSRIIVGNQHAWNIVKIGNQWYNVDSTYDSARHQANMDYEWFLNNTTFYDEPSHRLASMYKTDDFIKCYPMASSDYIKNPNKNIKNDIPIKLTHHHTWTVIKTVQPTVYKTGYCVKTCTCGQTQTEILDKTKAKDGWNQINGKTYFFSNNEKLTGLITVDGISYYLHPVTGERQTGQHIINGQIYYFDGNGTMHTGWQKYQNNKRYFNTSGILVTGWQTINGKIYYFNQNGILQTGGVHILAPLGLLIMVLMIRPLLKEKAAIRKRIAARKAGLW